MKKIQHALVFLFLVGSITACKNKIIQTTTYTANDPVYMTYEELRTSVQNENSRQLEVPGKIYLYGKYILVNEFQKGIHVYDNTDPSSPKHVAYINIPGNIDMAIKNDILYADSYVDLVAIDISDPVASREVGRVQDALSYTIPAGFDMNYPVANIDETKGVVIDYVVREVTETCEGADCGTFYSRPDNGTSNAFDAQPQLTFAASAENNVRSTVMPQSENGIAGSMARFMMLKEHLYLIVDQETVKVFNLGSPAAPQEVASFNPNANNWSGQIETLFSFNGHMFIGSTNGMSIYDVSNESNPVYEGNYSHFTSCDPVVANEELAFVTLRTGTTCGGWINQLDVLDINDMRNPFQIGTYQMTNPHGLGLDNDEKLVFVCDGASGLKVFNFEDPSNLKEVATVAMEATDVIPHMGVLHIIGANGLDMYKYDAEGQLSWVGQISL